MFLQVLEPFCPLSEQENSEAEEVEVIQPAGSAIAFITPETEFNSSPLPSDSSSLAHKNMSCAASLADAEAVSVPLTTMASDSLSDAACLPPSLSDYTSTSQLCPASDSPTDSRPQALSFVNDSFVPSQAQSEPLDSHPGSNVITAPLSEVGADESSCAPTENTPVALVILQSPTQHVPHSPTETPA